MNQDQQNAMSLKPQRPAESFYYIIPIGIAGGLAAGCVYSYLGARGMMRDHIRAKYEAGMKARGEKLEDQKTFLEFVPTPKSIAGGAVAGASSYATMESLFLRKLSRPEVAVKGWLDLIRSSGPRTTATIGAVMVAATFTGATEAYFSETHTSVKELQWRDRVF